MNEKKKKEKQSSLYKLSSVLGNWVQQHELKKEEKRRAHYIKYTIYKLSTIIEIIQIIIKYIAN